MTAPSSWTRSVLLLVACRRSTHPEHHSTPEVTRSSLPRVVRSILLRKSFLPTAHVLPGQDATEAFEDVGHSDEARALLPAMYVGDFEQGSVSVSYPWPPQSLFRLPTGVYAATSPHYLQTSPSNSAYSPYPVGYKAQVRRSRRPGEPCCRCRRARFKVSPLSLLPSTLRVLRLRMIRDCQTPMLTRAPSFFLSFLPVA